MFDGRCPLDRNIARRPSHIAQEHTMAIISPVESRSLKGRLLHLAIIVALSVGALTMKRTFELGLRAFSRRLVAWPPRR